MDVSQGGQQGSRCAGPLPDAVSGLCAFRALRGTGRRLVGPAKGMDTGLKLVGSILSV